MGSMFLWTEDVGLVSFGSAAWWIGDDESSAKLLVSEASNTCDSLADIADGSYEGAAFMVSLGGWTSPGPGRIDWDSSDPFITASAYVQVDGTGTGRPMTGSASWFDVMGLEPGGILFYMLNIDEADDPSRGAEGSGDACYCTGLEEFTFPVSAPPLE
jgi:hypothetical protein